VSIPVPILRSDQDRAKWAAGCYAAQTYCFDGARLGLGSGTTSHYLVHALAEQVSQGPDVIGVATSTATRDRCRSRSCSSPTPRPQEPCAGCWSPMATRER
jgi:ribose 5-phosphate isomerase